MYNLLKYLPKYYMRSVIMAAIMTSHEAELQKAADSFVESANQMFITKATTALSQYEVELGIAPNEAESYEIRRNRILSKKRGFGAVTLKTLEDVITTYIDGKVKVSIDYQNYTITVKFLSQKGIPTTINDVIFAVNEIIPAHLKVEYEFSYRSWNDVAQHIGTWNDVAHYTWDGLATTELVKCLYVDTETDRVYLRPDNDGNAILVYDENDNAYARIIEDEEEE